MGAIALALIAIGIGLIYASINNIAPIRTLTAILQNPSQAAQILAAGDNKIGQTSLLDTGASVESNGSQQSGVTGGTAGGGGAAIAAFALAEVGKPYVLGARGPAAWDCSGLTRAAVKYGTGIDLPHSATAQYASSKGTPVKRADLQVGDIVFPTVGFGHCGVYTGNDMIVDAAYPGKGVVHRKIWAFFGAKRFSKSAP